MKGPARFMGRLDRLIAGDGGADAVDEHAQ